jgi:uncharacterized membrane protein YeaQ/YmgE (transglycosylase-associated protein family)
MGIIVLIIVGSAMGWLASVATRSEALRSVVANMVFGTVGSAIAVFAINGPFGGGDVVDGEFSAEVLGVAFVGAIAALAIVHAFRSPNSGQGTHSLRRD